MTFSHMVALVAITLVAATINGAIGYGFSSITVPLALLFMSNRLLNPALVLLELAMNAYLLFINRKTIPAIAERTLPIIVGLAPGVAIGTAVIAYANPDWLKLWTYASLLPLIILQVAGFRRPIGRERSAGVLFGGGVGVLYSVTTISGPPLAVALTNQGLANQEFRAALGLVRLAESGLTALAYLYAGMFARPSVELVGVVLPSLLIGIPVGGFLITHVRADVFRRLCMSFDAWIVALGMSLLIQKLRIIDGPLAFVIVGVVSAINVVLLRRFFARHANQTVRSQTNKSETRPLSSLSPAFKVD